MAFFRFPHPWDPRYALPGAVLSEPPGRGTLVTKGLRRGTIDTVRTSPGKWAVPGYVMSESGQGAITTAPLPRRFVDAKAPDYLARSKIIARRPPVKRATISVGRGSLSGTVFDKPTLGNVASFRRTRRGPFLALGDVWELEHKTVTVQILGVPVSVTKVNVPIGGWEYMAFTKSGPVTATVSKTKVPKELAEKINSALSSKTKTLLQANPGLSKTPLVLLDQAKRSLGLIGDSEFYRQNAAKLKSAGFGDLAERTRHLMVGKLSSIDGTDVFGKHWIIVVEELAFSYKMTIQTVSDPSPLTQLAFLVAKPVEVIIKTGVDVTKLGVEAALKVLDKIMQTACAAAKTELAPLAGVAVGTAYGAPPQFGAQAVQIVASLCGQKPAELPVASVGGGFPLLPIAIAGAGALLLIMGMRDE